jgi:DNA-binding MarR family transcriptional regulator
MKNSDCSSLRMLYANMNFRKDIVAKQRDSNIIDSILSIIYDGTMLEFPRPEDPLSYFAIGIFRINGALLRNGDRITKAIGQSSARWHVLGQANFKPQTVAQIARNMGQARQSVQRVADVLAREGLVNYTNNTQDKRTQLLAVTSRGEAVLAEINARYAVWMQHITPKLGADNLALLARQMEQIATVLEQNESN